MMKRLIILGICLGLGSMAMGWSFLESIAPRLLLIIFGYWVFIISLGVAVGKMFTRRQMNMNV